MRRTVLFAVLVLSSHAYAAPEYQRMSDAEAARIGVKVLLGESPEHDAAAQDALENRLYEASLAYLTKTRFADRSGNDAYIRAQQQIPIDHCVLHARKTGTPQAKAEPTCAEDVNAWSSTKEPDSWAREESNLLRAVYFGYFLGIIGDEAFAREARARFARVFGHKMTNVTDDKGKTTRYRLEAVPLSEWSYNTIKLALEWGKDDPAFVAEATQALKTAAKFRCEMSPEVLEQSHEGGRYGATRWNRDEVVRPDVLSGGIVPCDEVKSVKSDKSALGIFKKAEGAKILAAAPAGEWTIYKDDAGRPTRKVRIYRVYWKEEF